MIPIDNIILIDNIPSFIDYVNWVLSKKHYGKKGRKEISLTETMRYSMQAIGGNYEYCNFGNGEM